MALPASISAYRSVNSVAPSTVGNGYIREESPHIKRVAAVPAHIFAHNKPYTLALLLALAYPSSQAAETGTDSDQSIARNAVRLFFHGCLKIYPDPQRFANWIVQNEFARIPPPHDKPFLNEKPGRVWAVDNKDVQYALAAQDDNLCSVFVRFVTAESAHRELQPMLDALLKPDVMEGRRIYVEELAAGLRTHRTYVYKMTNGRWLMTIDVAMSDTTEGDYQLALSATTSMRLKQDPPTP